MWLPAPNERGGPGPGPGPLCLESCRQVLCPVCVTVGEGAESWPLFPFLGGKWVILDSSGGVAGMLRSS